MEISDLITTTSVRNIYSISSKKRLFQEISEISSECYSLKSNAVFSGLQERELLGSTGVGKGVALPHARIEGLESIIGIFLRIQKPINFESSDRKPVDLIFCLMGPVNAGIEHLKALATVSRTMRDPDICTKLRSNDAPATLFAILTEHSSSKAA